MQDRKAVKCRREGIERKAEGPEDGIAGIALTPSIEPCQAQSGP
jgi:hypothetical protein